MTDQYPKGNEPTAKIEVESKDRGMFTFLGKKEEKPQEDVAMTDCEMTHVPEPAEKKEMVKPTLGSELHRFRSSSSSSSDEEGGERKKKKKGLKEKMKEKMSGQGEEGITEVAVENAEMTNSEEKKGILEKIKEKIPAQHKKSEEGATTTAHDSVSAPETGAKEKKGIMEKIKEKLPGYHKNGEEEKKES